MYKNLRYIEIIFENCNTIKINPEYIEYISFRDIYRTIFISKLNDSEMTCCKEFEIKLKKDVLNVKTHFQKEVNDSSNFENHLNTYKDITSICIVRNNKEERIYVLYNEENGINTLQKTTYLDDYIIVSVCENNQK